MTVIKFVELSQIFKDAGFAEKELKAFYHSVRKSFILTLVGKRSWPEIFRLEEKCQWPLLKMIGDPSLPIYRGADKTLLDRFLKTVREEKNLREQRSSLDKVCYWTRLRSVINERIELFTMIFDFTKKDIRQCEMVAERYSMIRERKIRKTKKLWQIGIGTGAATLAGAAAIWYISQRDKEQ